MVTINDIANYLGIAASTVSKGLNNATDISDETKEKVISAAIELGYTPKHRKKTGKKTIPYDRKVCVIVENIDYENKEQFSYDLLQGFKQSAELNNWSVDIIPFNLSAQPQFEYDKLMLTNNYSGTFIMSYSIHDELKNQLSRTRIPTVLFDNYIPNNLKVAYVCSDCHEGILSAVEHLTKLGHSKIAFLNGARNPMASEERTLAFTSAMDTYNLYVDKHLLEIGYYVPNSAKYHVPKFLEYGATAIICGNDIIASGAILEVQKRGLRVPEDISIIGYDDLPICLSVSPQITTIKQDRLSLGKNAANVLDCLIKNIPISKSILRSELVIRESTGKMKPQNKS